MIELFVENYLLKYIQIINEIYCDIFDYFIDEKNIKLLLNENSEDIYYSLLNLL